MSGTFDLVVDTLVGIAAVIVTRPMTSLLRNKVEHASRAQDREVLILGNPHGDKITVGPRRRSRRT